MKLTAPVPVPDRDVTEDRILAWINDEARPLLRQLRQALNYTYVQRQVSEASDGAGTFLRLWESPAMPTDATWLVWAYIACRHTSGAAQAAGYWVVGCAQSVAGTVTGVSSTTVVLISYESAAALNAQFAVDATARTVYLEARDDAVSPMRFTSVVTMVEGLP